MLTNSYQALKQLKNSCLFALITTSIGICGNCFSAEWTQVAKDQQGIHYIDMNKINYEERYETAHFKLLTNEYVSETTKLGNTSLITEYVVYCHPQPRSYNRYKIISYRNLWGKGKVTDNFTLSTGAWNIEDGKEIEISEAVCKVKRFL